MRRKIKNLGSMFFFFPSNVLNNYRKKVQVFIRVTKQCYVRLCK